MDGTSDGGGLELALDVWHPDCWTLHVTADTDASLLGHGLYTAGGTVRGAFTASAASTPAVEECVTAVRESPLTDVVRETGPAGATATPATAGAATRGVLVEWGVDSGQNIVDALVAAGFVPRRTYRMADGREQWSVLTTAGRAEATRRLDDVRAETDADIAVQRVTAGGRAPVGPARLDALSPRQREVFERACERGYYDWPRAVSATDLAADLGVTKSTVVEHLRKAESRLFTPFR
jgi:predicted DNA binding protein